MCWRRYCYGLSIPRKKEDKNIFTRNKNYFLTVKSVTMHKILNFLIIVLFKSTKGAEYMEAKMKLDNFRFDVNVIQTRHKGDVTDCAVKCTSRLDCLSIQYRDSTQTCRMFDTIFLTSDGASYENGWRYYLKTGGE